jgi:hypothetical protein
MSGIEKDGVLRIGADGLLPASHGAVAQLPSVAAGWLGGEDDDGIDAPPPAMDGASFLPRARALLPELERRRRGYEDALIDMRRARREAGPEGWRLRAGPYLALMLTATLLLTGGAHASVLSFARGAVGMLAALGFALNVTALAHLAGGWGRGIAGARSWARRILTALLTVAACLDIAALIWMAGMGWVEPQLPALGAMVGGAVLAVIASALYARPNPDLLRLLRREAEARRDYETVRRQLLAETAAARGSFEQEARALEATAAPLRRVAAQ